MIDIIIPAYNAEKTIDKCIESILSQTYQNFHLYIINDGSKDDTLKKLQKYKNNDKITVINQENKGASTARNVGIQNVTNAFFTFVDSDDYLKEDYLLDLINKQKENNYDLVISSYQILQNSVFSPLKEIQNIDFIITEKNVEKSIYNLITYYNADGICSKLYKSEIAKKIVMKNLQIGEDLLFNIQYLFNSKRIAYINKHNYIYVIQNNSLMRKPCYDLLLQLEKVIDEIENNAIKKIYLYRIYLEYVRNLYYNGIEYKHSSIPPKIKKELISDIKDLKNIIEKNKYLYYEIISKLIKYNNNFLFNKINKLKFRMREK